MHSEVFFGSATAFGVLNNIEKVVFDSFCIDMYFLKLTVVDTKSVFFKMSKCDA